MSNQQQNPGVRREMLANIRRQLAASAPYDAVRNEHETHRGAVADVAKAASDGEASSPVERFRQMLEAVSGRCLLVRDEAEAAEAVQKIVAEKDAQRIAVSDSPLASRVVSRANLNTTLIENGGAADFFNCDIGITGAQWAVAETGTLVLESERERHRLCSLVPTAHVAIVEAGQIRHTLGEVLQTINEEGADGLSRTVTFITGPSRTSDIELTLAIGVHGPQDLYVIVIGA